MEIRLKKIHTTYKPPPQQENNIFIESCLMTTNGLIIFGDSSGRLHYVEAKHTDRKVNWKAHEDVIWKCCLSDNENYVATASSDCLVKVWDISNHEEVISLFGHSNIVWNCLFFNNDEKLMSCSADSTIKIWKWKTQIILQEIKYQDADVRCIAISNRDIFLAFSCSDPVIKLQAITEDNQLTKTLESENSHRNTVTHLEFPRHKDDNILISSSMDKIILLWCVEKRSVLRQFKGHTNVVWESHLIRNGKLLLSCSSDHTVRVWNVDLASEIASIKMTIDSVDEKDERHQITSCYWQQTMKCFVTTTNKGYVFTVSIEILD